MHRAANISFFTDEFSKLGFTDIRSPVSAGKLCQHIIANRLFDISNSRISFTQLAYRSIRFAERAYYLRDWHVLEEASSILMNLPLTEAQQIGTYYQAITINRRGWREEASEQLEAVADKAPLVYRARAVQTLGWMKREQGHLDEALRLQAEVLNFVSKRQYKSILLPLMASWEIAVIKSIKGDNQGALEDFERMFPLFRFEAKQNPYYFYAYHNAVAVEFAELGRTVEAESAISIALASPFASAYPEWAETREEIEQKRNYRDLSHCFLDRSLTESEAVPESIADASVNTETQPQIRCEAEKVKAHTLTVRQLVG